MEILDRDFARYAERKIVAPQVTSPKIRFWRLVNKTNGCWFWTSTMNGRGYGLFHPDGTYLGRKKYGSVMAHRWAWSEQHGKIPKGKLVCHQCDEKLCVRPSHLFLATPKQNSLDMMKKGRHWTGPNRPNFPMIDKHHNLPTEMRRVGTQRRFCGTPRPTTDQP